MLNLSHSRTHTWPEHLSYVLSVVPHLILPLCPLRLRNKVQEHFETHIMHLPPFTVPLIFTSHILINKTLKLTDVVANTHTKKKYIKGVLDTGQIAFTVSFKFRSIYTFKCSQLPPSVAMT